MSERQPDRTTINEPFGARRKSFVKGAFFEAFIYVWRGI
ncbi:MAG: hypothetical protein ACI9P3_000557 [Bradyrhizobium sp.]|jgi:hypothetical protein